VLNSSSRIRVSAHARSLTESLLENCDARSRERRKIVSGVKQPVHRASRSRVRRRRCLTWEGGRAGPMVGRWVLCMRVRKTANSWPRAKSKRISDLYAESLQARTCLALRVNLSRIRSKRSAPQLHVGAPLVKSSEALRAASAHGCYCAPSQHKAIPSTPRERSSTGDLSDKSHEQRLPIIVA